MNKTLTPVKCNLCGNDKSRQLYRIQRFETPFNIVKCTKCGLLFMSPRLPENEIQSYYDKHYYLGEADYSFADERLNMRSNSIIYNKRLSLLEKSLTNHSSTKKILDIGCAFGGFLVAAREGGWDAYGIELSDYSANYAIQENKLNVQRASIENATLPPDHFDAAIMIEVIEHLIDPMGSLKKIYRSLKKNGVLLIQTANADSLKAKISRDKWEYFLPGHLYYFSRRTLSTLLNKAGFDIVKIYTGDELSFMTKFLHLAYSANSLPKKVASTPVLAFKHYLRKITIGNISIGGNVFLARKSN